MSPVWLILRYHSEAAPAIYVVDLADYVHERTDPAEDEQRDVALSVTPITAEESVRMVNKDPSWRRTLFQSANQGQEGEYSREEAIVRLQLMAHMQVRGAGTVRERYHPRTLSRMVLPNSAA